MIKKAVLTVLAAIILVGVYGGWRLKLERDRVASDDPQVWQSTVDQLTTKASTLENPVLFLGSSSIRFWGDDLQTDLADVGAMGRGFGGAKIHDIDYYAGQLIGSLKPRAIAVYIGANDISAAFGATALSNDEAERRYRLMLDQIRKHAVDVPVYMIALKPTQRSKARWPIIDAFNERLQALAAEDVGLHYLDANRELWNDEGQARSDALMFDGMHLSRKGYELWGQVIGERLLADGYSSR